MTRNRILIAGVFAGAALWAAAPAVAEPLPNPEPVPVPGVEAESAPVTGGTGGGEVRVAAPQVGGGGEVRSATGGYLDPVNIVPNINGDPCTGAWESTACYAMNFDSPPAVQPRSEISASP